MDNNDSKKNKSKKSLFSGGDITIRPGSEQKNNYSDEWESKFKRNSDYDYEKFKREMPQNGE